MMGRRLAQIHDWPLSGRGRRSGRETFIALRACRKAIKVARGMRFSKPIDVVHMYCQACGQRVDCSNWDEEVGIACPACGVGVRVPGYLRGAVRRVDEEPNELARFERELDEILPGERIDLTDKAAMVRQSVETDRALVQIEWNFMKRSTVAVLVLMAIGVVLYASMWVWVQAMGR